MESVGFAIGLVGLAGLFSTCLDLVDRVDSFRQFESELQSIARLFEVDKHRFRKWGDRVGVQNSTTLQLNTRHHEELDDSETLAAIKLILTAIQETFGKTEIALSSYQHKPEPATRSRQQNTVLPGSPVPQGNQASTLKRIKARWALKGKEKVIFQIQQFSSLVQRLYYLVPPDRAPSVSKNGLNDLEGDFVPGSTSRTMLILPASLDSLSLQSQILMFDLAELVRSKSNLGHRRESHAEYYDRGKQGIP
jgi:hypothetical protein